MFCLNISENVKIMLFPARQTALLSILSVVFSDSLVVAQKRKVTGVGGYFFIFTL